MKNHHRAVRFSFYTAVISFLAAATIFLLYFFSGDLIYGFVGYFATLLFGLVNLIALVVIIVAMKKHPSIRRIGATTIGFQLFNIPVALVCFWAGLRLTNIARINFVNETGEKLENVKILGCEEQTINSLEPNEEFTAWIKLKGDCSVHMEYVQNDTTVQEEVCGYLCFGAGGVFDHAIGGSKAILDTP
jgi:hypothetical protein